MVLLLGAYLFLLALLFAFVEIEIEGRYGWAERLPTWYRKTGPSRVFSLCKSGKPLTGYHLFMLLFMLAAFHFPFAVGLPWSVATELQILSALVLFFIVEDFLWFVFNPAYGIRNFRKGKIWWHSRSVWLLGTLNGSAVYAGSASYDEGLSIGIRYHFPVPLHRTSPDVDASRDGLLAAFRNRTSVAASYLALASEVPRATSEEAREEQPYFTDGRVLMLET